MYTKICVLSAYTCDEACSSFVQLLRVKSFGIVSTYMVAYFCYRARYGVQLEKSTFERRTADFLWMMIFGAISLLALSAIPMLWTPFLGVSLVFMLLYVWSREFPTAQISIYGRSPLRHFISHGQC